MLFNHHSFFQVSRQFLKSSFILFFFVLLALVHVSGQYTDSLTAVSDRQVIANNQVGKSFSIRPYIIPTSLLAYGLYAMKSEELKEFDNSVKNEVWTESKHKPIKIDNYLQYAPGFAVFGLRAAGVPGKSSLKDEVMLYLISNAVMGAIVNPLKMATHLRRPDGFGSNAFPSGHTATAFVGAEFLNQEYKDRSAWYSVAGYTTATAVGLMRIYNNRHWTRDVIAGAGIGMISTKLTYWLYPKIKRMVTERSDERKSRLNAMSVGDF